MACEGRSSGFVSIITAPKSLTLGCKRVAFQMARLGTRGDSPAAGRGGNFPAPLLVNVPLELAHVPIRIILAQHSRRA